ncbi:MAG: M42 family peptidase [Clostridiales bacterium]|nr:M42 family peptidase [Clostridiales bacterium]
MIDVNKSEKFLSELTKLYATSGDEKEVSLHLMSILSSFMPCKIDKLGSVVGTTGNGKHILLDAHIDQIGLIVLGITDDGFVKVSKCGGADPRVLTAASVTIHGKEKITGIVCSVPPHLKKDKSDNKVPDIDQIIIDTGYSKEKLDKIVSPGDRITFDGEYLRLLGDNVSSPCVDDRSGVVVILRTLEILQNNKPDCKISVLFSSQEETGGSGAKAAAFNFDADEAICVDVSFAKQFDLTDDKYAETGKGPMIGFSPVLDRKMSLDFVSIAQTNGIPYQREIMGSRTGTNADDIQTAGNGTKCSVISIPIKNMHTCVEVVDLKDIELTAQLIANYIIEKGKEND